MKPCIRNLPKFKKGCPENSSCKAWITTLGSLRPKVINKCADLVVVDLLWDLNVNMIGNQHAVESFRNNIHESAQVLMEVVNASVQMRSLRNVQGRRVTQISNDPSDNGLCDEQED